MKFFNRTPITSFSGEFDFLSNFFEFPILFEGVLYKTSEHAYQAQKSLIKEEIDLVKQAETPGKAKKLSKTVSLRPGWDEMKVDLMRDILWAKFSNPEMSEKLLSTKDRILIEGNNWGDIFWGVCDNKGKNMLGKLLMEIREQLKSPLDERLP